MGRPVWPNSRHVSNASGKFNAQQLRQLRHVRYFFSGLGRYELIGVQTATKARNVAASTAKPIIADCLIMVWTEPINVMIAKMKTNNSLIEPPFVALL